MPSTTSAPTENSLRPSISVFFPAYNDAGTIASMVLAALSTCARLTDDYEVIVVENGSTDYTVEVLEDLAASYSKLRIFTSREVLGYGGALQKGFKEASKELVFYTDGDAQYDPHELALLYAALRPDVDIVQGYKIARQDPLFRIIIGRVYHWTVKIAFGLPISGYGLRLQIDTQVGTGSLRSEVDDGDDPAGTGEEADRFGGGIRRGACAPLPQGVRAVAVLQLPEAVGDGRQPDEAVGGTGGGARFHQAQAREEHQAAH